MSDQKLHRLVLSALFAALCTVMTLVIQVPSPVQGYVNLGDCAVLLSAWALGPLYGGAAAGTGSMLADLLSGYPHYAPGTFVIKLFMAAAAGLLFRALRREGRVRLLPAQLVSGALAEALMVAGYFGYACLWLGKGLAAAASVPGNVVQGCFGLRRGHAGHVQPACGDVGHNPAGSRPGTQAQIGAYQHCQHHACDDPDLFPVPRCLFNPFSCHGIPPLSGRPLPRHSARPKSGFIFYCLYGRVLPILSYYITAQARISITEQLQLPRRRAEALINCCAAVSCA